MMQVPLLVIVPECSVDQHLRFVGSVYVRMFIQFTGRYPSYDNDSLRAVHYYKRATFVTPGILYILRGISKALDD